MREDLFLKVLNLILELHEICDCLVAFIGVVDGFQASVFIVIKCSYRRIRSCVFLQAPQHTVELSVMLVKIELRKQKIDVFRYQGLIT